MTYISLGFAQDDRINMTLVMSGSYQEALKYYTRTLGNNFLTLAEAPDLGTIPSGLGLFAVLWRDGNRVGISYHHARSYKEAAGLVTPPRIPLIAMDIEENAARLLAQQELETTIGMPVLDTQTTETLM